MSRWRTSWTVRRHVEQSTPVERPGADPVPSVAVSVVNGTVVVATVAGPVTLEPRDVSRLRAALHQAQAVALWERGRW